MLHSKKGEIFMEEIIRFSQIAKILSNPRNSEDRFINTTQKDFYRNLIGWAYANGERDIDEGQISNWINGKKGHMPILLLSTLLEDEERLAENMQNQVIYIRHVDRKCSDILKLIARENVLQEDLFQLDRFFEQKKYAKFLTRIMEIAFENELELAKASRIKFEKSLGIRLKEAQNLCEEKGIAYRTPDILAVLMELPNSVTHQVLEKLGKKTGYNYEMWIKVSVMDKERVKRRICPFSWDSEPFASVLRLAKLEAYRDYENIVKEKHLLLGILESDELDTVNVIKEHIKVKEFESILSFIRGIPAERTQSFLVPISEYKENWSFDE